MTPSEPDVARVPWLAFACVLDLENHGQQTRSGRVFPERARPKSTSRSNRCSRKTLRSRYHHSRPRWRKHRSSRCMPHGYRSRTMQLRHRNVLGTARWRLSDSRFSHERAKEAWSTWRSTRNSVLQALTNSIHLEDRWKDWPSSDFSFDRRAESAIARSLSAQPTSEPIGRKTLNNLLSNLLQRHFCGSDLALTQHLHTNRVSWPMRFQCVQQIIHVLDLATIDLQDDVSNGFASTGAPADQPFLLRFLDVPKQSSHHQSLTAT